MTAPTNAAPAEHGVNVPLLTKVLTHIETHPEEWDQANWAARTSCGTAYCVAGHTVLAAGHTILWPLDDDRYLAFLVDDGRQIARVAADELGLTWPGPGNCDDDRCAHVHCGTPVLFHADNSLSELWEIAYELTNGEIVRPVTS